MAPRRWLPSDTHPTGRALRLLLYTSPITILTALGQPVCLYAIVLHQPCPGCGLTRATFALFSGDIERALALNPLSPLVVPVAIGMVAYGVGNYVLNGRVGLGGAKVAIVGTTLCLALVAVWVARWFGAFGGPVPV